MPPPIAFPGFVEVAGRDLGMFEIREDWPYGNMISLFHIPADVSDCEHIVASVFEPFTTEDDRVVFNVSCTTHRRYDASRLRASLWIIAAAYAVVAPAVAYREASRTGYALVVLPIVVAFAGRCGRRAARWCRG